jgi:hypothetical protein
MGQAALGIAADQLSEQKCNSDGKWCQGGDRGHCSLSVAEDRH